MTLRRVGQAVPNGTKLEVATRNELSQGGGFSRGAAAVNSRGRKPPVIQQQKSEALKGRYEASFALTGLKIAFDRHQGLPPLPIDSRPLRGLTNSCGIICGVRWRET
jgi:hypothetical protein